jgi:nitrogen regulatory protein PII 1
MGVFMKMIKAVVRPEKYSIVLEELNKKGFRAATRFSILGRGKQRGLKVGEIYYDEIPKEMIMIVVEDKDESTVVDTIVANSKTSKQGSFGDGKIFVIPVERVITISNGKEEL